MSRNSHSSRSAEPRKRPRQQRSRELVARILDEAAHIFEARGYHDTTTNHVADAAEVSIGSLYQYFPNKDALLVGLAERHLEEVEPRLEALLARLRRCEPPADELCRSLVIEVAELNRSARLHHLLWSAPRTPALIEQLARVDEALVVDLTAHLVRFGHRKKIAPLRARVLVTVIDAGVHNLDDTSDRGEQIEELVRLATAYTGAL